MLFSCNSGEKQEVLQMDDIIPSSDRYKEGQSEKIDVDIHNYFDSLSSFSGKVSDTLGVSRSSVFISDSLLFPDRFFCRSKEKWFGSIGENEALISVWTYKDSLETKNALFNWLDCLSQRCRTLQLYEERKISKESFLIFATERKMIYISSPNSLKAQFFIENLHKMLPKDKILFVISQEIGKKTIWWRFEEKRWTVILA